MYVCTIVPGTILILHSLARSLYLLKYVSQSAHRSANWGSSGSQPVKWYSGRTASWAPFLAAEVMNWAALVKFLAGWRGYGGELVSTK